MNNWVEWILELYCYGSCPHDLFQSSYLLTRAHFKVISLYIQECDLLGKWFLCGWGFSQQLSSIICTGALSCFVLYEKAFKKTFKKTFKIYSKYGQNPFKSFQWSLIYWRESHLYLHKSITDKSKLLQDMRVISSINYLLTCKCGKDIIFIVNLFSQISCYRGKVTT